MSNVSRQRMYQIRHREQGLCQACSRDAIMTSTGKRGLHCAEHYERYRPRKNAYMRIYNARTRANRRIQNGNGPSATVPETA